MCGLAGCARFGGAPIDATTDELIARMMSAVAHRGPDGPGISTQPGSVRLGFQRLSLVDLATGNQPLVAEDDSVVLIANGEVYNHHALEATLPAGTRMRTRSDCEVLLHLYRGRGLRFLDDVHGMFALVLWDRRTETLVFARDRFGIKPLFWHRNADRIVFASEIKALFEDPATPRALDWEAALGDQIMSGAARFSTAPLTTWYRDIELVPASTIVTIDLRTGADTAHQYWQLPTFAPDTSTTRAEFVHEYGTRLRQAVEDCEMADVEIGLFLSGGVDSAAIAAMSTTRPQTFSALNGSTIANGDAEYSVRIAASLGLPNHQVRFDAGHVPSPADWLRFLWLLETPLAGPESFYKHDMYRYVRSATPHIKAMLLGGGADEFNGGYSTTLTEDGWAEFEAALRDMRLGAAVARSGTLGAWWQTGHQLVNTDVLDEFVTDLPTDPYEAFVRWKYRDVAQYNCWHEDRTAAGNGIEARVPFLDHRLIELGATIPAELRPELVWDKRILRDAVTDVLGSEYADRPKVPFFYGCGVQYTYRAFGRMLLAEGGELLERALSGPGARQYLNADAVRSAAHTAATRPTPGGLELLLRVVNLGLMEQLSADPPGHHHLCAAAAVPAREIVPAWTPQVARELTERLGAATQVDPAAVPTLDDSVLLLHGDDGTEWFVVVDGQIEFVVDELEDAAWLSVLRGMDGRRSLAELAGGPAEVVELTEVIIQATDAGLLKLATAPVADPLVERSR